MNELKKQIVKGKNIKEVIDYVLQNLGVIIDYKVIEERKNGVCCEFEYIPYESNKPTIKKQLEEVIQILDHTLGKETDDITNIAQATNIILRVIEEVKDEQH